jgi:hypothetical protein
VKDQYFGDVTDYRKYGFLKALMEGSRLSLGVCWLRTVSAGRRNGASWQYLHQREHWRHYDPRLYDALHRLLDPCVERTVLHAESWGLLPGARYYHALLSDDASQRHSYFADVWQRLRDTQLLFLDPDNGLEVQSVGYGRKMSAQYLYWHEVDEAYARGHSLVIYQHFAREKREEFVSRLAGRLEERLAGARVASFRTANAVYLTAVRPEHSMPLQTARDLVLHRWNGQFH